VGIVFRETHHIILILNPHTHKLMKREPKKSEERERMVFIELLVGRALMITLIK
jgi:hypothetical protein